MNQEIHADEQVAQPVLCDKSARHLTSNLHIRQPIRTTFVGGVLRRLGAS